jgi:hypothetical protein
MIRFCDYETDSAKTELFHYLPTLANLPDSSGCCSELSKYKSAAAFVQRANSLHPVPRDKAARP